MHKEGHREFAMKVNPNAIFLTKKTVERENNGGISAIGRLKEDISHQEYSLFWTNAGQVETKIIISPSELISEVVSDFKAINGELEVVSEEQIDLEDDYIEYTIIYRKG